MEELAQISVSFWHFPIGIAAAICFGVLCHVVRAVFNVFPDRISDSHIMDIMVSRDYSFWDWYYGTEYNDAGYYELHSTKNLRLSIIYNLVAFVALWFVMPAFPNMVAFAGNWLASSFGEAFISSIAHYTQN